MLKTKENNKHKWNMVNLKNMFKNSEDSENKNNFESSFSLNPNLNPSSSSNTGIIYESNHNYETQIKKISDLSFKNDYDKLNKENKENKNNEPLSEGSSQNSINDNVFTKFKNKIFSIFKNFTTKNKKKIKNINEVFTDEMFDSGITVSFLKDYETLNNHSSLGNQKDKSKIKEFFKHPVKNFLCFLSFITHKDYFFDFKIELWRLMFKNLFTKTIFLGTICFGGLIILANLALYLYGLFYNIQLNYFDFNILIDFYALTLCITMILFPYIAIEEFSFSIGLFFSRSKFNFYNVAYYNNKNGKNIVETILNKMSLTLDEYQNKTNFEKMELINKFLKENNITLINNNNLNSMISFYEKNLLTKSLMHAFDDKEIDEIIFKKLKKTKAYNI